MNDLESPRQNHLLNALPSAEYGRLFPHLERVSMAVGDVLNDSRHEMSYAYFPSTCIISKLYITKTGESSEIAMTGNEGMIGIALFMGGETIHKQAVVLNAGYAYRLRGSLLIQEFNRAGGRRKGILHDLLLRYTQVLLTQMAQTAVCNRHHLVEQQFCRWLLLRLDQLSSNQLTTTQELIATMLGVRRESITEAAGELQRAGLIEYSRSTITVLNRPGIEYRVCECYQVVKAESNRLLACYGANVVNLNRNSICSPQGNPDKQNLSTGK